MKVLVIGGTGNISRGIVAALLARNHEVVLFNRGQHADPPPPDVRVIKGDRQHRDDFESKVSAENWDAVIDMISFNAEDAASAIRGMPRTNRTLCPMFHRNDLWTSIQRYKSPRNCAVTRHIGIWTQQSCCR